MGNSKRIQRILDNLDITFERCEIAYTTLEDLLPRGKEKGKKKKTNGKKGIPFLKAVLKAADYKLDQVSGVSHERFVRCTFSPEDKLQVKRQVSSYQKYSMKFRFVDCKFVRRESTCLENLVRKLRRIFGTRFELNELTSVAVIEDKKFKVKDIPELVAIVVERIRAD